MCSSDRTVILQEVLHRDALVDDLEAKYQMVFKMYSQELANVENSFRKDRENPPVARDMPPTAGKIHWSRQLWRQIRL